MTEMTAREREARAKLRDDFEFYAPRCLIIRPKEGPPISFTLNRAQRHIHTEIEKQRAETGRVRAIILKGRQQGCSTYVGGRYYWRATHTRGVKVYILTHEGQATENLFEMVNRYHENSPDLVKPSVGKSNAKELAFDKLDSAYKVGTAGNRAAGRSLTAQLFHGSEVAFWENADEHAAGVMQAVPDAPDTEVILESTAKGVGNFFHQHWQDAVSGLNGYVAIFVPWFWQGEYRKAPPPDFELSHEEDEIGESEASYAEAWGLDDAQMFWRRHKIRELKSVEKFREEYPATPAEAFQNSGTDSFIKAPLVVRARKRTVEPSGPFVIGYDPAWTGGDRHAIAIRRGRKIISVEGKVGLDTMQSAGWLKGEIDRVGAIKAFVDVTGVGAGVYDRLKEMGYGDPGKNIVVPISFGASPFAPKRYSPTTGEEIPGPLNRRAEVWLNSRDWLEDEAGVDIPDLDELQADACGPGFDFDSQTRLVLESKKTMRKRGLKSPDLWEAIALTLAEPVIETQPYERKRVGKPRGWAAS